MSHDDLNRLNALVDVLQGQVLDLSAKVRVLEFRAEAQESIVEALAVATRKDGRVKLLQLLTALQLNALARGEDEVSRQMQLSIERFVALTQPDLTGPVAAALEQINAQSLLFASIPPELKKAQGAWLAQATTEEIAQELEQHLRPRTSPTRAKKPKSKPRGDTEPPVDAA
ncbi:MAG: hypothetical protein QM702_04400 [Rubrivivax sp.]